jgi:hypothetical protein
MKKALFLVAICLSASILKAQSIEDVKKFLMINQFKKAKEDLDKAMGNAKFAAKAEAYILKASIYAALSLDEENKNKPVGEQLLADAVTAYNKYKEMDKELKLLSDATYENAPVNIYSSYYGGGYNDYKEKKWETGFVKLQKAVEMSDFLITRNLIKSALDTNVVILAGIVSEQGGKKEDAAKYYGRLADAKIGGNDFESIYRYLVSYYFTIKNIPLFEKYKAIGAELYPNAEYYKYDKIDFAVGLEKDMDAKIKAVGEVLATDPNNLKANLVLGEIIYDTLNSDEEGAVLPANAEELEKKMVEAFTKAAMSKANNELPYLYIGDHFINKAVKVNEKREAHTKEMQARTKPGTKSSPEDLKKREDLDKLYGSTLEGAQVPYEKACEIFAERLKTEGGMLELKDKQQYKKAASYLADVYAFKKIQAKGKPADQAKFAAEEKKWNEAYETISAIKEKKKGS